METLRIKMQPFLSVSCFSAVKVSFPKVTTKTQFVVPREKET